MTHTWWTNIRLTPSYSCASSQIAGRGKPCQDKGPCSADFATKECLNDAGNRIHVYDQASTSACYGDALPFRSAIFDCSRTGSHVRSLWPEAVV